MIVLVHRVYVNVDVAILLIFIDATRMSMPHMRVGLPIWEFSQALTGRRNFQKLENALEICQLSGVSSPTQRIYASSSQ